MPFFSILIPAKGRPDYLREAIKSVLFQGFTRFELLVSNNGSDKAIREVVEEFEGDDRIEYLEQKNLLNMPEHWEVISCDLKGQYFLILTDRSVFRQGALSTLHSVIENEYEMPEVISWPWDLYLDHIGVLSTYPREDSCLTKMEPAKALLDSVNNSIITSYMLPRGLNSCVRVDFLDSMRKRYHQVFRPVSPDYTFAFICLLNANSFYYFNQSLFVSQGLKVSNGGNTYSGDVGGYLSSLGKINFYDHVPLKLPLVLNLIHQDFLAMLNLSSREDLITFWDRVNYFSECAMEIREKRRAGVLSSLTISKMEIEFNSLLSKESSEVQDAARKVGSRQEGLWLKVSGSLRSVIREKMPWLYRFMLLRKPDNQYFKTSLEAAGFELIERDNSNHVVGRML